MSDTFELSLSTRNLLLMVLIYGKNEGMDETVRTKFVMNKAHEIKEVSGTAKMATSHAIY